MFVMSGCANILSRNILTYLEASAMITQKGKMNVNLYPTKQPNEMYNIEYRVPFQPPNEFNNDKLSK